MGRKFLCLCGIHAWGSTQEKGDMRLNGPKDRVWAAKVNGAEYPSILHATIIQDGVQACTRTACTATRNVFRTGAIGLDGYMSSWRRLRPDIQESLKNSEIIYAAADVPAHW